jgi:N-acetylmuramoyl-L-alanine amidase
MKPLSAVEFLVVHHSASNPRLTTVGTIREWHVADRGWDDIGYHFCITDDGHLHTARPLVFQGAHAPKVNAVSWGVCVVGDNTRPGWEWNHDQEDTLLELIDAVRVLRPGIKVVGHRDTGQATECPGLDINTWLKGVM